ncbi:MAG: hypothetical protein IPJ33_15555 [Gammaproteobacteria bacterium]|nr:hypothetical protein [Gammaproteobacteria bacterium]
MLLERCADAGGSEFDGGPCGGSQREPAVCQPDQARIEIGIHLRTERDADVVFAVVAEQPRATFQPERVACHVHIVAGDIELTQFVVRPGSLVAENQGAVRDAHAVDREQQGCGHGCARNRAGCRTGRARRFCAERFPVGIAVAVAPGIQGKALDQQLIDTDLPAQQRHQVHTEPQFAGAGEIFAGAGRRAQVHVAQRQRKARP